jgi:anti-sigma factor RsiW
MIDHSPPPVTEDELHAYLDRELPPDRVRAVEAWLATHPEDMARVNAWRAQVDAIRTRYGAAADERVPVRFEIDRLLKGDRWWKATAAAAAVIAFLLGGAGGWTAREALMAAPAPVAGFQAFTAEAIAAHKLYVVEVRHPVEVPAADADHLIQWLSKRVGYQLKAPKLESIGLKLVGGRLLPGPTGAAAFLMYESASGERYTIYCGRSSAPETALRYSERGTATAVYWASQEVAYVISGSGDRQRLGAVATAAYEQLDGPPPAPRGG